MTQRDGFDRTLFDWLDETAGRGTPDYLGEVLARTTRTRQRPAWSSLERLLPVQMTFAGRLRPIPSLARAGALLAILLLALAALLAAGVGRRHLPPLFGLARNGTLLYGGADLDIHTLNPVTGATTVLIGGTTVDTAPRLSPDGTRLLFLRDAILDPVTGGKAATIMVANDDGSNVRPLSGRLENIVDLAWSHDGSRVAVSAGVPGTPSLQLFTVDGPGKPLVIDTGGMETVFLAFRPGDRELTFLGSKADVNGLYAIGVDGTGLRTIVPRNVADHGTLSPDGTKIAYQVWDGINGSVRIADVATGKDVTPTFDPPPGGKIIDDPSAWSPDGSQLLFVRWHGTTSYHLAVMPATGGHVVEIGPLRQITSTDYAQYSPDGTSVLAYYAIDGSTWLLDPSGSTPDSQLSTDNAERAAWQRLAP